MSFENPIPPISQADYEAARELIERDEALKRHPRVQELLANDFIDHDGRQIDAGNFLAAVKNAQEAQPTEAPEAFTDRIDRILDAMVIHSESTR
jgi:hypothetical protein